MKIKVELEQNETIGDAEEVLQKALNVKQECDHGERYSDDAMNEAHTLICEQFDSLLTNLQQEIKDIVKDATRTAHTRQD
jgi:hypothetical protein